MKFLKSPLFLSALLIVIMIGLFKVKSSSRIPIFEKVEFTEMSLDQKDDMLKKLIQGRRGAYQKYHNYFEYEMFTAFKEATGYSKPVFNSSYGYLDAVDLFRGATIKNAEKGLIEISGTYKSSVKSKIESNYLFLLEYQGKTGKIIDAIIE